MGGILLFFEKAYLIRVTDIKVRHKWYQTFLQKAPDFIPHDDWWNGRLVTSS